MASEKGNSVDLMIDPGVDSFLAERAKQHPDGLRGVISGAIARYSFLTRMQAKGFQPLVTVCDTDGAIVDVRELVLS
ncbi:hypothetical protein KC973_01110 [Candidatus Saccharibacteria bacterium]|nr:hypothetical protein [Candidatus Saccharibacteria bacterium]